jgi:hypothetical protein
METFQDIIDFFGDVFVTYEDVERTEVVTGYTSQLRNVGTTYELVQLPKSDTTVKVERIVTVHWEAFAAVLVITLGVVTVLKAFAKLVGGR